MTLVVGFDLDMTLVDSRPGIIATWRALAAETGVPIDAELCASRIGPKLETEMANWFAPLMIDAAVTRYREIYAVVGVPGTELLPGAGAAVEAIRGSGGRVLVLTAKHELSAARCLDQVGLTVDMLAGDRFGHEKTRALIDHGACAYVGDASSDVRSAIEAGARAIGITTGSHTADELTDAGADLVVDSLYELVDLAAFVG